MARFVVRAAFVSFGPEYLPLPRKLPGFGLFRIVCGGTKMWRELAAAFLSLFCITSRLNAATTQQFTITKDPQAIAIAAKAIAAMGGAQALLTYQDSVSTGTLTLHRAKSVTSHPVTFKSKGTQETRAEFQMPTGTSLRIVNQGRGIFQNEDGTIRNLQQNNTYAERVNHIPLLSGLSEYQGGSVQVQYQGTALVNNQVNDVIAISYVPTTDPLQAAAYVEMTQSLFFVNQTTALVDKIQYTNFAENDVSVKDNVEVYFSEYKNVGAISVPFIEAIFVNGNLDAEIVLQSVAFNAGLSDAEFALPKAINAQ